MEKNSEDADKIISKEMPKFYKKRINRRIFQPDLLAVYVAFLAVLLSQFPPLHTVMGKAKPELSVDKFIIISHDLGKLNFNLPITILNSGSRTANIKKISCEIESESRNFNRTINVQAYYDSNTLDGARGLMNTAFGGISVKPDESWQNTISCFDAFNSEATAMKMALGQKSRDYFRSYFADNPVTKQNAALVALPDEIFNIARAKFDEEFWLKIEDYKFTLTAELDNGKVIDSNPVKLRVSTFDYEILMNITNQYKYGFGISMPLQVPYTVQILVEPIN